MKTNINNINITRATRNVIFALFILSLATACNSSLKEHPQELTENKPGMRSLLNKSYNINAEEQNMLRQRMDSVISIFNTRLAKLEKGKGEEKMGIRTKEMLAQLKMQRDSMRLKLQMLDQQSGQHWIASKMQIQKDIQEFANDENHFFMKKNG